MPDSSTVIHAEQNERIADENINAIEQLLRGDQKASESKPDVKPEDEDEILVDEDGLEYKAEKKPDEEQKPEEKSAVDYDVEVPLGNGVKMTVGALKDFYADQASKELELIDIGMQNQSKLNQLREIAQYLGTLPPELVEKAGQQRELDIQRERSLLSDVLPEFQTNEGFTKGTERIMSLAKEYGLENDVRSITSHKALKLIHDFAVLKERVRNASLIRQQKKELPRAQQKAVARKLTNNEALIAKAKQTGSESDQLAAISALL